MDAMDDVPARARARGDLRSPLLPLLVMAATLAGWFAFQTLQLVREQTALTEAFASQTRAVDEAKKLRASLDTIARETQLLSDKGNPNARLIVDELRKRGVTINPDATPAK